MEITNIRRENERLRRELGQQEALIKSLRLALDEAAQNVVDLKRKNAEAELAHEQHMNDHIRECQQEILTLREQLCNVEIAKPSGQAFANSIEISDTAILGLWKGLSHKICSLANAFLTRCPEKEEWGRSHQQDTDTTLQMTAVEYALLSDVKTRSAVVEHLIWRSVIFSIFGIGQQEDQLGALGVIAGTKFHGHCCALIPKISQATAADFFYWRPRGAVLVETIMGLRDQVLGRLALREQVRLSLLLPLDSRKNISFRDALYQDLLNIFRDALGLFSTFIKSRALFYVYWVTQSEPSKERIIFNPEVMEAKTWGSGLDDGRRVVFNVSPGLSRFGTVDGIDYDRTMILAKPRVLCD
ncbi:uncharacterized protein CTRU02_207989 [Colletotrichum truncatum]|uniref:Uncharacterized protein n=1 Tax=Colletotrichum truncatum TaxID=5467 RepID=A0ACC3Z2F0_COLTU|nr:uncharacterized protein CTRU02_15634 [Colletotrichum truncatum]KAF6780840.1 hypothetical protein CTRU02_15634 [Colletotrichum truncatum]